MKHSITAIAYTKSGRIISIGNNSYIKTHPLQASLASSVGHPHKIYLHAEIDAIIKARGEHIHTLKIFRLGKSGKYLNAAPCAICQRAIQLYGINHVIQIFYHLYPLFFCSLLSLLIISQIKNG